jgi:protocatechuate 4,5-dioxygenase, beta chain
VIMWLAMRGAMNAKVRRVHRFYQMPVSLTGAGLVLFENETE